MKVFYELGPVKQGLVEVLEPQHRQYVLLFMNLFCLSRLTLNHSQPCIGACQWIEKVEVRGKHCAICRDVIALEQGDRLVQQI